MKFSFDWFDYANAERLKIVFENRHKEFGAFVIRNEYKQYVVTALLITLFLVVSISSTPLLISYLKNIDDVKELKRTDSIILEEPPPIDKSIPPPPVVIPPSPIIQTIKFTPPKIVLSIVARENGIAGWVYITFIVDKDGKVKESKVLQGIGGGCDEEALRVVNGLPDWIPGRQKW